MTLKQTQLYRDIKRRLSATNYRMDTGPAHIIWRDWRGEGDTISKYRISQCLLIGGVETEGVGACEIAPGG